MECLTKESSSLARTARSRAKTVKRGKGVNTPRGNGQESPPTSPPLPASPLALSPRSPWSDPLPLPLAWGHPRPSMAKPFIPKCLHTQCMIKPTNLSNMRTNVRNAATHRECYKMWKQCKRRECYKYGRKVCSPGAST